jgi:hypothetical protein
MTSGITGTLKTFRHVFHCRRRFNKKPGLVLLFRWVTQSEVGRSEVGRSARPQNQPNRPSTPFFVVQVHNLLHVASRATRTANASTTMPAALPILQPPYLANSCCHVSQNISGFFYFTVLLFTYVTDNYPLRTRSSFLKRYREVPHH